MATPKPRALRILGDSPELASWAESLPDAFLDCRNFGHAWYSADVRFDSEQRLYLTLLRCRRCTADRTRRTNEFGGIEGNAYSLPDGYLAPSGMGTVDRSAIRHLADMRHIMAPRKGRRADG